MEVGSRAEPSEHAIALPAHLPTLDGLRGLAIFLVVAHMLGLLTAPDGFIARAVSAGFTLGWVGVQLFFSLSGFLITGILLDTQRAANYYSGFFARRTLRIFPLYYATLFVALVVLPMAGTTNPAIQHDRQHQIWLWTYLSNWVTPYAAGSRAFPHFWSLAVEEQFYFLWPFLIRRLTPLRCVKVCLALAALSLGVRFAMLTSAAATSAIYTFSITRMDALVLGAAAAAALRVPALAGRMIARRRRLWAGSAIVAVVGALSTHLYSLDTFAGASVGYSFLSVVCALTVAGAACADFSADGGWVRALRSRPLRALGKYSYGIYVFHKPLHDFAGRPLLARLHIDASHSWLPAVGYVAGGLLVASIAAYASYWLFERRFLRLKSRFSPRTKEET